MVTSDGVIGSCIRRNNGIATLCVTYGRPDRARQCFESWLETRAGCSEFYFVVDENDPILKEYEKISDSLYIPYFIVAPTLRRGMCDPANFGSLQVVDNCEAIQFMADDFLYRTKDWDLKYMESHSERQGKLIWYGNDLLQGQNLPTSFIVGSKIVRALGYICNPKFQHLFIDNWIKKLGEETGTLIYEKDVIIEHMHPGAGKSDWDANYRIVQGFESSDLEVYKNWLTTDLLVEANLIRSI